MYGILKSLPQQHRTCCNIAAILLQVLYCLGFYTFEFAVQLASVLKTQVCKK